MGIFINENNLEFHLQNDKISYILKVDSATKEIQSVYFGSRIHHRDSYADLSEKTERPSTTSPTRGDHRNSMEFLRREYPDFGHGDFRTASYEIITNKAHTLSGMKYERYECFKGRDMVFGVPHIRIGNEDKAETLIIHLYDSFLQIRMKLFYLLLEDYSAIVRKVSFENLAKDPVKTSKLMSFSIDLPSASYDLMFLKGAWSRERHIERIPLHKGVQSIGSTRGSSSHTFNPFVALLDKRTTEHQGEVYGFSLLYSGNFLALAEVDNFDVTRVMMGIHPQGFSWNLKEGEIFYTPEAVLVYSNDGLNGLSQEYHKIIERHIIHEKYRNDVRPVLINNWEATYFNFDEETILAIAREASNLGFDLLVLDDGWFGRRNDDKTSLSEWTPNYDKLPNGISGISKKVTDLGIQFGLWFEPEMVSDDTRLYNENPDFVLGHSHYPKSHGRNQFVLDFSNEAVVNEIFERMKRILNDSSVSYVKWDMNRSITEAYSQSLSEEHQGEFYHRYILGVYKLYEMLTDEFPHILFESCAGGGGRFDLGLLYYAPQTWTSDDTDAWERVKIQYGTSMIYPIKSMGSHVSAVPNHQVGRNTSLKMRHDTAIFGTYGYELDITTLSDEEKIEVRNNIEFFKTYQNLIHHGKFYRLLSPFDGEAASYMVISECQSKALVYYSHGLQVPNAPLSNLKLRGLDPAKKYHIHGAKSSHHGDELMNLGVLFTESYFEKDFIDNFLKPGDFKSLILEITEIK